MACIGDRRGPVWHGRLVRRWKGSFSSVEFDWGWAMRREEEKGDVLGFYHTHPGGLERPSARDVRTMQAWSSCFGKPLLCIIRCDKGLTAFVFRGDRSEPVQLGTVELFPRNVIVAVE